MVTTDNHLEDTRSGDRLQASAVDEPQPGGPASAYLGPADESDGTVSRLTANLLRAAHLLRTALNDHLAEFKLNDVRYAVLVEVHRFGSTGCTQTELAERLWQSESNICTLVERMRQDGWLYRHRAKSDRRKRILRLTERARETLDRIRACHEQRLRRLLSGLSADDQRRLDELLGLLCDCLEVRLGGAGGTGVRSSSQPTRRPRLGENDPSGAKRIPSAVGLDPEGRAARVVTSSPRVSIPCKE